MISIVNHSFIHLTMVILGHDLFLFEIEKLGKQKFEKSSSVRDFRFDFL